MSSRHFSLSALPGSFATAAMALVAVCITVEIVSILWMASVIEPIVGFYRDAEIILLNRIFPRLTIPLVLATIVASLIVVTPVLIFKAALQSGLRTNPSVWLSSGSNLIFLAGGVGILCGVVFVEITLLTESAKAGLVELPCDPVTDPLRCVPLTPEQEAKRLEKMNHQLRNAYRLGAMLSGVNMAAGLVTAIVLNRISK